MRTAKGRSQWGLQAVIVAMKLASLVGDAAVSVVANFSVWVVTAADAWRLGNGGEPLHQPRRVSPGGGRGESKAARTGASPRRAFRSRGAAGVTSWPRASRGQGPTLCSTR